MKLVWRCPKGELAILEAAYVSYTDTPLKYKGDDGRIELGMGMCISGVDGSELIVPTMCLSECDQVIRELAEKDFYDFTKQINRHIPRFVDFSEEDGE